VGAQESGAAELDARFPGRGRSPGCPGPWCCRPGGREIFFGSRATPSPPHFWSAVAAFPASTPISRINSSRLTVKFDVRVDHPPIPNEAQDLGCAPASAAGVAAAHARPELVGRGPGAGCFSPNQVCPPAANSRGLVADAASGPAFFPPAPIPFAAPVFSAANPWTHPIDLQNERSSKLSVKGSEQAFARFSPQRALRPRRASFPGGDWPEERIRLPGGPRAACRKVHPPQYHRRTRNRRRGRGGGGNGLSLGLNRGATRMNGCFQSPPGFFSLARRPLAMSSSA